MGIARSTYYNEPTGSADDTALVEAMHAIKDEFEAYGWRRMQAALRHRGWVVNHKKIKRLMREHALHPVRRRPFVATTDSDHDEPVFPNRSREREADGPNQLWVADLTYIAILGGFIYLAAIMEGATGETAHRPHGAPTPYHVMAAPGLDPGVFPPSTPPAARVRHGQSSWSYGDRLKPYQNYWLWGLSPLCRRIRRARTPV